MAEQKEQKTLLQWIRTNMWLVVIIVGISLLVFILTDFLTGSNRMNAGSRGSIGYIAGEKIDRTELDTKYQLRQELMQRQGQSMGEMERNQLLDGLWNGIVEEKIYGKQYESLGITISDEELQDMFTGKNVSPVVKQYFDNFFKSQNKPFNVEDVKRYLSAAISDPAEKVNLKEFEDYLISSRLKEKFETMVAGGYVSSKLQAARANVNQGRKYNISFVGVNYSQIADSTIKVEDNELKAFMSKNAARFKQEEETIIKFVQYDLRPTPEDSLKAKNDVLKYKEKFATAKNDSSYVYSRSRKKFDPKKYVPLKDIPAAAKDSVKLVAKGTVFGPVLDNDAYKLFKLVDSKKGDVVNAKVSHILITPKSPTAADSAAAMAEASAIKSTTNATNFKTVVMEKSQDNATKMGGGDLGWVSTPSSYGKDFDNAITGAGKGSVVGPVKSPQGYHILYIEDKTDEAFLVAEVEKIISVSSKTADFLSKQINDFATKAIQAKDIEAASKAAGIQVRQSNPLKNNDKNLLNMPARDIILWAVSAKEGDFSKVYTMNDSYVFAQVFKKKKEGLQDLEDVRPAVLKEVLAEKKGKIIADKLSALQGKSMEEIKTAYGPGAFVSNANDVNFESQSIPSIGNDPYVVGRICGMAKGATSKPIVGKNGVYIVQVSEITEPTALDENSLKGAKKGQAQNGQSQLRNRINQALLKMADVKDERWKAGI
ncbi:MAG: SurA N-terminal domain-containing protein [Bacteroidia bacterium]|nr:SurA N-terminal domain-containing protein [Bacteroidia bacterium]